jgi:hypothetical protein
MGGLHLGVSGIEVGGVLRLGIHIRPDRAVKDTADFFSQRVASRRALTCDSDNLGEF